MPAQSRLLFLNLPVSDLDASKEFFGRLGFEFDPRFTDETCACMVISDQAYAMLLTQEKFATFASKPVADPGAATQALFCVSAETREGVDEFADAALAAGGSRAGQPLDMGFMCSRSFNDLDGHTWEVVWMDPKAVEQGPAEYEAAAA